MGPTFLTDLAGILDDLGLGAWRSWGPIILMIVGWLGLVAWLLFLVTRIRYRIGPRHLSVTLLGLPLRRIAFGNIRAVHTHKPYFSEKWYNTLLPTFDRFLVIEKRRGLFKSIIITPEMRYVFKADLDRAIRGHLGLPSAPTVGETTTYDKMRVPDRSATERDRLGQG
jgi:hypothetical protein